MESREVVNPAVRLSADAASGTDEAFAIEDPASESAASESVESDSTADEAALEPEGDDPRQTEVTACRAVETTVDSRPSCTTT